MSGANIKIGANSSEFQKQMSEVNRQLKLVSSECSVAATKANLFGSAQDKLAVKQKELTAKLQAQNAMLKLHQDRIVGINGDIDKEKQKREALGKQLDAAKRKYDEVSKATGKNSDESKKLKEEKDKLQLAYDKTSTAIEANNRKLDDATIKLNNTEKNILNNQKALEEVNKEISNSKIDKLADGFEKAGDKVTSAGKKMSVVSAGIVGVGSASVAAFNAVDDGADNVLKATGAVGEAAKELEENYKNVASNIVGDFGSIGNALGEVNTRFGFTGSELETCTEQFMKFSEITGTDATTAVQLVSRAMGDAGIDSSEYNTVLDALAVAAQASGIGVDRLTDSVTKYGAPMRALGYDTKESIAIFASWEKAGVNTEIAFSGMKAAIGKWGKEGKDAREEFKKTIDEIAACPDIAEATSKSIEIFGQKAGPDLADAIQGGRFEFEEMLKVIEGSEGTVNNTFDGLIDGGYDAELTMQNAKLTLSEVGDVILQTVAPVFQSLTEKLKIATQWFSGLSDGTKKNIVMFLGAVAAIGPLLIVLGSVFSGISKIVSGMKALSTAFGAVKKIGIAVKAFALANPITLIIAAIVAVIAIVVTLYNKCEWFRDGVKAIFEALKEAWNTTVEFFKGLWSQFVEALKAGIDNMKLAWDAICEAFKIAWDVVCLYFETVWNFWKGVFKVVCDAIKAVWQGICDTFKFVWQTIVDFITRVWNGWKNVFETVGNIIKGIWDGICNGIKFIWEGIVNTIKSTWNGWKNIFESVGNTIKGIWQGITNSISSVWDGVVSGVKNAWQGIISPFKSVMDSITNMWDGIKSMFKLPHFSISGKFSLVPPSIPKVSVKWYHTGGIFKSPTVLGGLGVGDAFNGQGSNAEAIVPLNEMYRNIKKIVESAIGRSTIIYLTNTINLDSEEITTKTTKKVIKSIGKEKSSRKILSGRGKLKYV